MARNISDDEKIIFQEKYNIFNVLIEEVDPQVVNTVKQTQKLVTVSPPVGSSRLYIHELTEKDSIQLMSSAAGMHREERLRQARWTFNLTLGSSMLGILIVLVGVVLLLIGNIKAGTLTSAVGAVTHVISALSSRFNRETNKNLDDLNQSIIKIHTAYFSMDIIALIEDPKKRDQAYNDLAKDLRTPSPPTHHPK